jgi:phosphohistidine phosphatase
MRTLLLLRHAKSSWSDPALADIDRPLAPRGRKAAPRIGRELAARGWLPDFVLVSPAARTHETWDLVAAGWTEAPDATFRNELYMGSPNFLLAELKKTEGTVSSLLMIGHNPGLEQLARRLAGPGSDERALARLAPKFPTAAVARFTFDERWADLDFGGAKLTHFLRPKDLD